MTELLYIGGVLLAGIGALLFLAAETSIHEIGGAMIALIGAVLFVGAFLSNVIKHAKYDIIEALQERNQAEE